MVARTIGAAALAALLVSCSGGGIYETGDFMKARERAASARTDTAKDDTIDGETTSDVAEQSPPSAPGQEGEAAADGTPPKAAATAEPPAEVAETPPQPEGLAVASLAPARPSGGLLSMFRARTAEEPAALAAATAPAARTEPAAPAAPSPLAEIEEVSEAELAGETEADPDEIPPPEEPFDDGEKHDFVNVYTSRPDRPVESVEGLPGVTWEGGGIIFASRTPNEDPAFFGGDHPFARAVPGIPRQTVRAANGLLLAHSAINVSCLKPNLLNMVRRAESHFGKKVVVTSGYRSPTHNRRVRGALHSQHLYCNALDLYMPGVARDDLARFFFAQPERGGIGLYCHTRSIHVDTGRKRQWRWPCRRKAG